MEPAASIIEKCGGFAQVAKIVGRDETRVRRWTYSKSKGGTGGLIPSDSAHRLMNEARKRGLPLTPDDFFPLGKAVRDGIA